MRRAAHQLLDSPRIYEDPLALAILGEAEAAAIRADPARLEDGPFAQRLRAFLAIRSRLAEEALGQAVDVGVQQYVVLGAGLDTFAYRNPYRSLRVFEVDHPATQCWKRKRLEDAHITVPRDVTFVGADFDIAVNPLPVILQAAGLHTQEPSFFSWLGVTPYLKSESVLATLKEIAPLATNGGGIVFDYIISPELLGARQRVGFEALATRVATAGEPFRSHFEPSTLVDEISDMGFRRVRELGPDELNATFFANRTDGLQVGGAGRILIAFR